MVLLLALVLFQVVSSQDALISTHVNTQGGPSISSIAGQTSLLLLCPANSSCLGLFRFPARHLQHFLGSSSLLHSLEMVSRQQPGIITGWILFISHLSEITVLLCLRSWCSGPQDLFLHRFCLISQLFQVREYAQPFLLHLGQKQSLQKVNFGCNQIY